MKFIRSLPRPLRWLLGALVAYVGLFGVGLTATFVHYSRTPTFAEFVASTPVEDVQEQSLRVEGETLAEGRAWRIGEVDPAEIDPEDEVYVRLATETSVDIRHGDATLVDLDVEIALAARDVDWTREGIAITVGTLRTHPDMRALVTLDVGETERFVGPESEGYGAVKIDVLLLSGAGPSEVRVMDATRLPPLEELRPESWLLRRTLFGFFHPLGSPPDWGLVHRVRTAVHLSWQRTGNGYGGPGLGEVRTESNTREYSVDFVVEHRSTKSGGGAFSTSTELSRRYTWNGEVW